MIKFPSIESFAHRYRVTGELRDIRAKIKLHGTNGGVRIRYEAGEVIAQSRNNVLVGSDNAGFAAWVKSNKDKWLAPDLTQLGHEVIVFGEWAGKGIQSGDAVTKLDNRKFFIFAIYVYMSDIFITDPEVINTAVPKSDDIVVLPWFDTEASTVNHKNVGEFVETVNAQVESIGLCDPFILEKYNIEGTGEGLVFMPATNYSTFEEFTNTTFKAKSEAHRVKKSKKAITPKVSIPEDVSDFILSFVTDQRLNQGLAEVCEGRVAREKTSEFIKWVMNDVRKESCVEIEGMGIDFKIVAPFVAKAARDWYQSMENKIAA